MFVCDLDLQEQENIHLLDINSLHSSTRYVERSRSSGLRIRRLQSSSNVTFGLVNWSMILSNIRSAVLEGRIRKVWRMGKQ